MAAYPHPAGAPGGQGGEFAFKPGGVTGAGTAAWRRPAGGGKFGRKPPVPAKNPLYRPAAAPLVVAAAQTAVATGRELSEWAVRRPMQRRTISDVEFLRELLEGNPDDQLVREPLEGIYEVTPEARTHFDAPVPLWQRRAASTYREFPSMEAFVKECGSAWPGYDRHHCVERNSGFPTELLHSTKIYCAYQAGSIGK